MLRLTIHTTIISLLGTFATSAQPLADKDSHSLEPVRQTLMFILSEQQNHRDKLANIEYTSKTVRWEEVMLGEPLDTSPKHAFWRVRTCKGDFYAEWEEWSQLPFNSQADASTEPRWKMVPHISMLNREALVLWADVSVPDVEVMRFDKWSTGRYSGFFKATVNYSTLASMAFLCSTTDLSTSLSDSIAPFLSDSSENGWLKWDCTKQTAEDGQEEFVLSRTLDSGDRKFTDLVIRTTADNGCVIKYMQFIPGEDPENNPKYEANWQYASQGSVPILRSFEYRGYLPDGREMPLAHVEFSEVTFYEPSREGYSLADLPLPDRAILTFTSPGEGPEFKEFVNGQLDEVEVTRTSHY